MPPVRNKDSKRRRRQDTGYIYPSRGRGYKRQQAPEYTARGPHLHSAVPTPTTSDIVNVAYTNAVIAAPSPRDHLTGSVADNISQRGRMWPTQIPNQDLLIQAVEASNLQILLQNPNSIDRIVWRQDYFMALCQEGITNPESVRNYLRENIERVFSIVISSRGLPVCQVTTN